MWLTRVPSRFASEGSAEMIAFSYAAVVVAFVELGESLR